MNQGIASIFPSTMNLPFIFRNNNETVDHNHTAYLKDQISVNALSQQLDDDTEFKIHIAGHDAHGGSLTESMEVNQQYQFQILVDVLAKYLDDILRRLKPNTSHRSQCPLFRTKTYWGFHRALLSLQQKYL